MFVCIIFTSYFYVHLIYLSVLLNKYMYIYIYIYMYTYTILIGTFNDMEAEQVELLRDRKILDLNSSLLKIRNDRMNSYIDRLSELSNSSQCLAQVLNTYMYIYTYIKIFIYLYFFESRIWFTCSLVMSSLYIHVFI
jgi:hypothetical protein